VEQALRLLPDVEDLAPLRGFVVSLSTTRGPEAWAAGEPNRTIGKRTVDPVALRAEVPVVLNRVTNRAAVLYDAAVDALESEQNGDLSRTVRALVRAGEYEEQGVRYSQAHAWYRQALGIAEQLRDRQPEMEALCHLGRLEATRGYLDESARAFQRSLALAEAESDHEHGAVACQGLGNVVLAQSEWVGAEAWFNRGLQYARNNRGVAAGLSLGLGESALRSGQPHVAAKHLARALEGFDAVSDDAGIIRTLLARGRMEAKQGRSNEALSSYRQALARLPAELADPVLELAVRLRLAELYLDLGRILDTEDEARRAENIAITHHLPATLARVYMIMGKLRGRQGDENGFVFFEQAIELCRSGDPARRLEADVYSEYAHFRATMGDHHEARAYLQRARELLEPFGDEVARERIDDELRELDQRLLSET
jgi:tetratricopeptide (TPR) repeat protein